MTIRHMRIFRAVIENENNLTRAARQIYMAQPAVTLAIQELEEYYGVNLFDRLGKRLYLTEAGKQFQDYVIRILGLFDDMEEGMRSWGSKGMLRIGSSVTIGSQFLPGYVESYAHTHPDVNTQVLIGASDLIEKKILSNDLDIGLVESPVHEKNLIAEQYMEDYLVAVAPGKDWERGMDASGNGDSERIQMSAEEFALQHLLLREPGSGTRESFDKVMAQHQIFVKPSWEATSTTALINAVISGLGISVVPRRMVEIPLRDGKIREIQIDGVEFKRYFYLVYHRDKLLTTPIREFMDVCRNYENSHSQPEYSGLF